MWYLLLWFKVSINSLIPNWDIVNAKMRLWLLLKIPIWPVQIKWTSGKAYLEDYDTQWSVHLFIQLPCWDRESAVVPAWASWGRVLIVTSSSWSDVIETAVVPAWASWGRALVVTSSSQSDVIDRRDVIGRAVSVWATWLSQVAWRHHVTQIYGHYGHLGEYWPFIYTIFR